MPWRRKLLFAALATLMAFGAAEAALRLVGFSWQPIPERIWIGRLRGGIPTAEVVFDRVVPGLFTRDARLFWKPVAGRPPFNAAGLRDTEELPPVRPAGELRVLALGDSCTFLGEPQPWTDLLEQRLAARQSRPVRVLNAAVPAWSSLQGLRYLESRGLELEPDVITIYFGWNDHWRATVKPDAAYDMASEPTVALQRLLSRWRVYQGVHWLLRGRPRAADGGAQGQPFDPAADLGRLALQRPFRVPLEEFESNLRRMAELARGAGALPVFITAPSTLSADWVPDYLFTHGFVARGGPPVEEIHARYAAAVRRIARDTGSPLVDAAAEFAAAADGGRAWVRQDGIHLTAAGLQRLAELVADTLEAAQTSPSSASSAPAASRSR